MAERGLAAVAHTNFIKMNRQLGGADHGERHLLDIEQPRRLLPPPLARRVIAVLTNAAPDILSFSL